ncbi:MULTISPECIES: hypothetical protein [unclassified Corallococcus]|uniref:hypothetical protein n=1 Tax=unclassified Corallococcus TaxID=2685029 RepID=UPI001A8F7995|nr:MULTISPECIES: hypothetical protein [unclassified Corallococcus]MBN9685440.1 hypothetical protein [Corallococcus sp. NCSPR001]WAS83112.1 hypothetical protein O0N60_27780 [Corallococcus sp. NCRR]
MRQRPSQPPSVPKPPAAPAVYVPPAILWEQPFVALAQLSMCTIPGESECVP